jgi:cold shock CspA family protein
VAVMAQGRVDWYSANLGHGFILSDYGATKGFMRREDIVAGEEENLENNDRVAYEVAQGMEGPVARNVSRL